MEDTVPLNASASDNTVGPLRQETTTTTATTRRRRKVMQQEGQKNDNNNDYRQSKRRRVSRDDDNDETTVSRRYVDARKQDSSTLQYVSLQATNEDKNFGSSPSATRVSLSPPLQQVANSLKKQMLHNDTRTLPPPKVLLNKKNSKTIAQKQQQQSHKKIHSTTSTLTAPPPSPANVGSPLALAAARTPAARVDQYQEDCPNNNRGMRKLPRTTTRRWNYHHHHRIRIMVAAAAAATVFLFVTVCYALLLPKRTTPNAQSKHSSSRRHHRSDHSSAAATTTAALFPDDKPRTLRDFLNDPSGFHLAMAPSFFGFYGYFGALSSWDDDDDDDDNISSNKTAISNIRSVAGASAGAMAAILLSAGVSPQRAADFCGTVQLHQFADFPGILAVFQGNRFEKVMDDFLRRETTTSTTSSSSSSSLQMQHATIPVAVTAFDLQTMQGQVLKRGSMARAARASATFPFLFQPVAWQDDGDDGDDYVLIDGGITDLAGLKGLEALLLEQQDEDNGAQHQQDQQQQQQEPDQRVINLVVGDFFPGTPGPSSIASSNCCAEFLSISIQNLPPCGPWAMSNGPRAVEAAKQAMAASLDVPLYSYKGKEANHYELHIDASSFWQ